MFDIVIYAGADYKLTFSRRDPEGNLIDMTGADILATVKPFPESREQIVFASRHNGQGGKVQLSIPHSTTEHIHWSKGVYDVFITDTTGYRKKVLWGNVKIVPAVTEL